MLDASKYERYSRQILLPEIGEAGQQKLLDAKVLVIGAGGLGCPILQYLTGAGVGTIGIADDDAVSLSNLHRQVLYTVEDIGKPKAVTAKEKLRILNDDVALHVINNRVTNINALDIIANYDIVVDGSDNFSTRYLVNDACVLLNKPLVYGSIFRFEGQVAVFNHNGSTNYRDVFPEPPSNGEVPDCSEAGVLGVLPAIIGSLMANEVIKLIAGVGTLLVDKLLTYNSLYNSFYEIDLEKDPKSAALIPKDKILYESYNYELGCIVDTSIIEIDADEFSAVIESSNTTILDVREIGEQPIVKEFEHLHIPLSELKHRHLTFDNDSIILFCQSGKRSKEAASIIKTNNPRLDKIYSLKGGIVRWKNQQKQVK